MARLLALALTPLLLAPAFAQSQKVGDPPEASNMRLVGMHDLQARSAYQPTIHRQGDRTIASLSRVSARRTKLAIASPRINTRPAPTIIRKSCPA